ncbi:CLOCK-interacting pacemaker isoform X2 [Myripristis murdjan]|uniref:Si:ch211-132b12.7 n=3 Tax=Myripristis murdjan TaxID=586833 RepID=A0A667Z9C6_9TELE|nr:CLOCK-interacting pacemaker-like isoform X2 [Myripristis murdjan]XP_029922687.1 CLOCK-interacting pacemaker-like isoform X2 [Myripristis murdjan]
MPKEQPCLSECGPCTSSKNAKDKSNSTTLLALRGAEDTDDSSGRGSRCSSEKDSGYSDNSSDWQQTDAEDRHSSKSQPRNADHGEAAQPGQGPGQGRAKEPPLLPVNPVPMPGRRELTPIYIIKNVVLKKPDIIQKRGQLLWGNSKEETSSSGATHVILLQKPSIAPGLPATIQIHKTQTRKTNTGRKINGTYLPILNSYPRIAPHPSKKPPDKTSSSEDSQNLSKRVCTEHKSDNSLITSSRLEQQLSKQPESAVLTPGLPGPCSHSSSESHSSSSPTIISSSLKSPSVSNVYTSSFLATRGPHRNSSSSARHCRFLNTVEILRQSGLLDITLRTQELLRQSNATQRDIVQLRQHTQLLCQAASNPNGSLDGNTAWKNLHQAMRESGNYPSLKILQNEQFPFHPDSTSHPESGAVSESNRPTVSENSDVPPSPLPNPMPDSSQRCPSPQQPHAQQGRECKASGKPSEKVIIMPPDSSTGDDVL